MEPIKILAALVVAAPAVLAGCATTRTPLPGDAHAVYCVSPDRDCSQEAAQVCPDGYRTLGKESWATGPRDIVTDQIPGTSLPSGPSSAKNERLSRTEHTKLIIACGPTT